MCVITSRFCESDGRSETRRGQAARCFYNCLVLVGGGYLDAAQDVAVPFGDIVLTRGPAFSVATRILA